MIFLNRDIKRNGVGRVPPGIQGCRVTKIRSMKNMKSPTEKSSCVWDIAMIGINSIDDMSTTAFIYPTTTRALRSLARVTSHRAYHSLSLADSLCLRRPIGEE